MAARWPQKFGRVLLTVWLAGLLVLLFYRPVEVGDDWWHLSVGRWIAEHHQVPVEDPFPFAGEKTPWLHTHWLGSYLLYETYRWGGIDGLKAWRAGYFILIIGIFFACFYRRTPFGLLLVTTIFLANGLSNRHFLRPDLFNFLFLSSFLILLMRYERLGARKLLYALPFLGALWFNLHLGAAIYGTAVLAAFISSLAISSFWQQKGEKPPAAGYGPMAAALALAGLAFGASFLITPLGWPGLLAQLKIFISSDDKRMFYETLRYIGEAQRPQLWRWGVVWFWGLAGLGGIFLILRRARPWSRVILFLTALAAFLWMQRNSGFFALTAAYIIADSAADIVQKKGWQFRPWQKITGWVFVAGVLIVFSYLMLTKLAVKDVVAGRTEWRITSSLEDFGLARAVDFLQRNHMAGPVLNTNILTGGYLLWAGYPDLRPFIDGRSIDFTRFLETQAVLEQPERYWPRFDQKQRVDIVLGNWDKLSRRFLRYLHAQPEWKLVYVEGTMVIYVRTAALNSPTEISGYEETLRSVNIASDDIGLLLKARQDQRGTSWQDWLETPPSRVDDWDAGITLLSLGYDGAGVRKLADGIRQGFTGTGKEIPQVLRLLHSRGVVR